MYECWRVTWRAPTARPRYLSTLSACRSRHCRLRASPGARHGEPIGMAPLPRHPTDPMDTQVTTRRPTLPTLTHTEVAGGRSSLKGRGRVSESFHWHKRAISRPRLRLGGFGGHTVAAGRGRTATAEHP